MPGLPIERLYINKGDKVNLEPLHHGGRLSLAVDRYGIAVEDWLDLSTGINPCGWPVPPVPASVWSRLPEDDDDLEAAARTYYGTLSVLAVAGSQAAIQLLPRLWSPCRIAVISPTYAEHAAAWAAAGHQVRAATVAEIDSTLPDTDIMVLVNPNNPTGHSWSVPQLLDWQEQMAARGGVLVIDEAFADSTPGISMASFAHGPGLVVLRSLGKFFGLAGLRLGFVFAAPATLGLLRHLLGPWHVSAPARWAGAAALRDQSWQIETRACLQQASGRLQALLTGNGLKPGGGCSLFQWVRTPQASEIHEALARCGILTRLFSDPAALRIGLPGNESAWQRLEAALKALSASSELRMGV